MAETEIDERINFAFTALSRRDALLLLLERQAFVIENIKALVDSLEANDQALRRFVA